MKGITKLLMVLSAATVVLGYTMVILNAVSLRKSRKIEKEFAE